MTHQRQSQTVRRWQLCILLASLVFWAAACSEDEGTTDKITSPDTSQSTDTSSTSPDSTTPDDTSGATTSDDTSGTTTSDDTSGTTTSDDTSGSSSGDTSGSSSGDTSGSSSGDTSGITTNDTVDAGDTSGGNTDICPLPPSDLPSLTADRQGRFVTVSAFPGENGLSARDLTIYLPADYDAQADTRYPVLYMHDGQNLFHDADAAFGTAWEVDDTLDALVNSGKVRPHIIVGIHNTPERIDDYTISVDPDYDDGGNAGAYMIMVAERIKPYVDANYRTLCGPHNTAIAGSSLGGLVSFYQFMATQGVFGRVAAVSPSFWWNGEEALTTFEDYTGELPARLWIDAGSGEGSVVEAGLSSVALNSRAMVALAQDRGMILGEDLAYMEDIWATHDEASWEQRLPSILGYILTDSPASDLAATDLWVHVHSPVITTDVLEDTTAVAVNTRYADTFWLTTFGDDPDLAVDPGATQISVNADGHLVANSEGTALLRATKGARAAGAAVLVDHDLDPNNVTLVLTTSTPPGTQGPVYVIGSAPGLGAGDVAWGEPGVQMVDLGGGYWAFTATVPADVVVEYKYTRGSWATVEKGPSGEELQNRTWSADAPALLRDAVANWAQ